MKALKDGTSITPSSLKYIPPVNNGGVLTAGEFVWTPGGIALPQAVPLPQVIVGAESVAGSLGITAFATSGGGGGSGRNTNPSRSESDVWKKLKNEGNGRRSSGSGRKKKYYEWDNTHKDIEVYNARGEHLGSMDPVTGEMYKPAVSGRTIDI